MGPGLYVVGRSANSGLQVHWIGQAGEAVGVRRKVEALLQSRHTGINLMYNTNIKKSSIEVAFVFLHWICFCGVHVYLKRNAINFLRFYRHNFDCLPIFCSYKYPYICTHINAPQVMLIDEI